MARGVARLVLGQQPGQGLARARIQEHELARVPAGRAQREGGQGAEAGGDLGAHPLDDHRAVAAALGAGALAGEGQAERVDRGGGAAHVGAGEQPLQRGGAQLPVGPAVGVLLHPSLGRLVEEPEPQRGHVAQQLQQPPLELGPEDLLLPVLVGRVRERRLVDDPQAGEPLAGLLGEHGGPVVGQERPREPPLQDGLGEAVHQARGRLGEVALEVAAQAGVIVEDRQRHRLVPAAGLVQHPHPGLMEVEVPERVPVTRLEAAHLARLPARGRPLLPRGGVGRRPAAQPAARLHLPPHRLVAGQDAQRRPRRDQGGEVVVVQLHRPAGVGVVLRLKHRQEGGRQRPGAARVGPELTPQRRDRVGPVFGLRVPALEGGEPELHPRPGPEGVLVGALGARAQRRLEVSPRGRTRQQPPDHREPEPRPALRARQRIVGHRAPPSGRAACLPHGGVGAAPACTPFYPHAAPADRAHLLRAGAGRAARPQRPWSPVPAAERHQAGDEALFGVPARSHETVEQVRDQAVRAARRPQAADQPAPGGRLREDLAEVAQPAGERGAGHAEEHLEPVRRDPLDASLPQRGDHQDHRAPVDAAAPEEHRGRQDPAPTALPPAAPAPADGALVREIRGTAPGLPHVRAPVERTRTGGHPRTRVVSARSTSRVWRRVKWDFRCRTSGGSMTPALSGVEGRSPLLRSAKKREGAPLVFPHVSRPNQLRLPSLFFAALNLHCLSPPPQSTPHRRMMD